MDKLEMTEAVVAAKQAKGVSWEQVAEAVGLSPVYVAAAGLGQSSMPREYGEKLANYLELSEEVVDTLAACPMKGMDVTIPSDPLLYRFHEIMQVYGVPMKEIIHEKFGDGIMSAIDFTLDVDRQEDPKGDRVVVTMNGKFLPYKIW